MFRTKKIAFFDTVLLRNYIFSYKFFQKNDFFSNSKKNKKLFGTYYYVYEMKNSLKNFRSIRSNLTEYRYRILRRLSQKNVFLTFNGEDILKKKFNRVPSDREFFSLSNGTNQFSIYTLSREKNSIFKKFLNLDYILN